MAASARILIAGGGTGGHVYPAIAIAKAIQAEVAAENKASKSAVASTLVQIEFVGTPSGIEAKIVPREGFHLNFIPIGRLNKNVGLLERITTLVRLPLAILKGVWLVIKFRPTAVIGVGGYASAPVLLAAALCRFRTFIWEPNAYPGLANRWLAPFVDQCLVVFSEAQAHLRNRNVLRVRFPVRAEIENPPARVARAANFRILIFGGSQGARAINNVVAEAVAKADWRKQFEIVHQTGPHDFARIQGQVEKLDGYGDRLQVHEYLHDMGQRYAWADLVIARSGTGTISELAACGKAAILIPLPTAADNHQLKNAEALTHKNAAVLLEQKDLTADRLIHEIVRLAGSPALIDEIEKNVRGFHEPRVAERIARILLGTEK